MTDAPRRTLGGMLSGLDPWELPVLGAVDAPAAVLIRPDGHVARVGDAGDAGLSDVPTTWFGASEPAA